MCLQTTCSGHSGQIKTRPRLLSTSAMFSHTYGHSHFKIRMARESWDLPQSDENQEKHACTTKNAKWRSTWLIRGGKCCPSCLAHSTGFPTIVISKIDNGTHYSQAIVSFSGTNYKKKQKKSTRPVIVTKLWRTVPSRLCLSLRSQECWHDAEKHTAQKKTS